jgi:hypothetical protein
LYVDICPAIDRDVLRLVAYKRENQRLVQRRNGKLVLPVGVCGGADIRTLYHYRDTGKQFAGVSGCNRTTNLLGMNILGEKAKGKKTCNQQR